MIFITAADGFCLLLFYLYYAVFGLLVQIAEKAALLKKSFV